jgi:hypothetical protein
MAKIFEGQLYRALPEGTMRIDTNGQAGFVEYDTSASHERWMEAHQAKSPH